MTSGVKIRLALLIGLGAAVIGAGESPEGEQAGKPSADKEAVVGTPLQQLDAEIAAVTVERKGKLKELEVQGELEAEKAQAMAQVQREVDGLHKEAVNYRKEADVASSIAKEKSAAVMDVEKAEREAKARENRLEAEGAEMAKFMNQTASEEAALEKKLVSAKLARAGEASAGAQRSSTVNAPGTAAQGTRGTVVSAAAEVVASAPSSLSAVAIERLIEENKLLKKEKDGLVHELSAKKAASEKAKLRQKLRNRLVAIDRVVRKSRAVGA